ncbi:MAG: hypothetical protein LBV76_02285 [Deltaproteobacteria bacterium]|jgi:hypothetical protein|nr:hypothetical protein [Deltaproteobacteria bacterium]
MRKIGKNQAQGQKSGILRRVLTQLFLFVLLWILFTFVVIPWDTNTEYPAEAFPLIEGQRAYAEIIRKSRPSYLTTLRGLNMVQAKYTQEQPEDKKIIKSGNVRLSFDTAGEFLSLEILK